ncbi:Nucleoside 2-deoxyribosyltransferase [Virgibacillus subterraneus]|uniref:Nucleoside 2-deoxyribosyltransferase n=1 Tax=Virgibacillus subterraneus TaxID=621109 RepID=A0A1H8Z598_9BACI|nr:nucleoside 2-deoxyribosyltransferase [Virgibacillus subterraneus]SEP59635.1 Nucleoside 2-deoxyribosyltransferase [Virgibacillus subterraneus]
MNFYVASGFANIEQVQYVTQKLQSRGYNLTYDWTRNQRATSKQALRTIGELEKEAVLNCDFFILLLPGGKGSHTELGMALALEKRVYIYSAEMIDKTTASTFYYVHGVERFYGEINDFVEMIGLT